VKRAHVEEKSASILNGHTLEEQTHDKEYSRTLMRISTSMKLWRWMVCDSDRSNRCSKSLRSSQLSDHPSLLALRAEAHEEREQMRVPIRISSN